MSRSNFLLVVFVGGVGCNSALGFIGGADLSNADSVKAKNPLSAAPLQYEAPPRGTGVSEMREKDCTVWPLQDTWKVEATSERLCVEAVRHQFGTAPLGIPAWTFAIDGKASPKIELEARDRPRKIGECTMHVPPDMKVNAVWKQVLSGCVPNGGLLSSSSRDVRIQQATAVSTFDVAAWTIQ